MQQVDWNAKVQEALDRTNIMALSTIGTDGSWTCPVHFNYDKNFKLSFQSMSNTKHVKNILQDPRVSVAIYQPEPFPDGGNLGLQIKGTAKLTSNDNAESWHRFEITPTEVWCFDSRVSRKRRQINMAALIHSL